MLLIKSGFVLQVFYIHFRCFQRIYIYIVDTCPKPQMRRHATMLFKRSTTVPTVHIDLRRNSILTPKISVRFFRVIIHHAHGHSYSFSMSYCYFIILTALLLDTNCRYRARLLSSFITLKQASAYLPG